MGAPAVVDDPQLRVAVAYLVSRLDPVRIILFGSRARGEARVGSDFDLLVIEDDTPERRRTRGERLCELYDGPTTSDLPDIDVLLHGVEQYERLRDGVNHVIARAAREGVTVYERA